jgi:hypothetical protein
MNRFNGLEALLVVAGVGYLDGCRRWRLREMLS